MPFTTGYKLTLLNKIFYNHYLGLGSGATSGEPTIDSQGTGSGYQRVDASVGSFYASDNSVYNRNKIRFDEALSANGWGTINYLHVYISSTGTGVNNMYFTIPLTNPVTIRQDEMPKFDPMAIIIEVDE